MLLTPISLFVVLALGPPADEPAPAARWLVESGCASELARLAGVDAAVAPPRIAALDEVTSARTRRLLGAAGLLAEEGDELDPHAVTALRAFGLLDPDDDLAGSLATFFGAGGGGAFDPASGELLCLPGPVGVDGADRLLREVVIQLRWRSLDRPLSLEPNRDPDAALARLALLEGEARLVVDRFRFRYPERMVEPALDSLGALDRREPARLALLPERARVDAPPYLFLLARFPAEAGHRYLRGRFERAGDGADLDEIHRRPPRSTAEILGLEPLPPSTNGAESVIVLPDRSDRLGIGWQLVRSSSLGALHTDLFIRLAGDPVRAEVATTGLAADRYRLYEREDGAVLLQWEAAFRTAEDAAEMVDALRKVLQRRFHAPRPPIATEGEEIDVRMEKDRSRASASTRDGDRLRGLAVRREESVTFLLGLRDDMDVDALIAP